jgi:tetratricopeptide (TPR) repeat protein
MRRLGLPGRPAGHARPAAEFDRHASVPGAEPVAEYGFVGRDLDIQAIERRVLTDRDGHQLLVRGMAGAGKSTLLAHLAWWWQRTGLVDHVFRFSYEDRAWTSAQIIRDIRARLMSPAEQAQAGSMTEQAQAEQVAALLRATRHLLILDNTESVTAAPAAIPHTLTPAGQVRLKAFLAQVRGGRTLVLLGSREPETWLTGDRGGPGTYELPGLDPQAASVLVERILARHRADRYLKDGTEHGALQELVTLLGGYPLSLTVVLPALAADPPSAVLAELKAGGRRADPGGLVGRAIEYSHGQLDPALQNSLLLLAPFTAVIGTGRMLERYRDRLLEHEAVRALGPVDLAAALDQAVSVGLATPHPQHGDLVQVQPVLPYFLRSRLRRQPAWQAAASQAHYLLYRDLVGELTDMLYAPGDPRPRLAAQGEIRAEYANLTTALGHGLRTGQPVAALIDALDTYLRQSRQHETRRQLLDDAIAAYLEPTGPDGQIELAFLHEFAGGAAFGQHRLDVAEAHFKTAIGLLDTAGNRKRQSALYHQLARVAHDQKQYDQAEASYCRALDIDLAYGDQSSTAITHHQLGVLAHDEKRYDQAEASYRKALDIFLAHGDQHNAASTYGQLGVLAHDQKHYDQAEASYRKALDIFLAHGDQHNAASIADRLGAVLAELGRHHEAVRILTHVAVVWHQDTGQWTQEVLRGLQRERAVIGPGEFTGLLTADLPAALARDLIAAIEADRPLTPDGQDG